MVNLIIAVILNLLSSCIDARRRRRRFGLKLNQRTDHADNDVITKTVFDDCSESCRTIPKQQIRMINNQ